MLMEGNSTIVKTWWTISTDATQPSLRRPEKLEPDRSDETSTDFPLGNVGVACSKGGGSVTNSCLGTWLGGAALALGAPRGCLLYLVALLPLLLSFRFDVLVTIYLYDSL